MSALDIPDKVFHVLLTEHEDSLDVTNIVRRY
jgi:hypothetical protein